MSEQLPPLQAVRLLRAKGNELEAQVLDEELDHNDIGHLGQLRADIALVAHLLADHIERMEVDP